MKRVLVIGNAGSGKTTFSRQLAEKTGIPLVHLDKIYWRGEWEHLTKEEFVASIEQELSKESWIIDGNFNRTIPYRLKFCDTVFFFDFPTVACLWGVTKRILTNYKKTRDDMGGNCPESFDKQKKILYKNVIGFNKQHRKSYYKMLCNAKDVNVVIFRSRKQVKKYLKEYKKEQL